MATLIFKIEKASVWQDAVASGTYAGAPVDQADGFIHFSAADQVAETLSKHFADQTDLVLVAFDADAFGDALKWEVSRGGAKFPHLYATLDPELASGTRSVPEPHDLSEFADWGITA